MIVVNTEVLTLLLESLHGKLMFFFSFIDVSVSSV